MIENEVGILANKTRVAASIEEAKLNIKASSLVVVESLAVNLNNHFIYHQPYPEGINQAVLSEWCMFSMSIGRLLGYEDRIDIWTKYAEGLGLTKGYLSRNQFAFVQQTTPEDIRNNIVRSKRDLKVAQSKNENVYKFSLGQGEGEARPLTNHAIIFFSTVNYLLGDTFHGNLWKTYLKDSTIWEDVPDKQEFIEIQDLIRVQARWNIPRLPGYFQTLKAVLEEKALDVASVEGWTTDSQGEQDRNQVDELPVKEGLSKREMRKKRAKRTDLEIPQEDELEEVLGKKRDRGRPREYGF